MLINNICLSYSLPFTHCNDYPIAKVALCCGKWSSEGLDTMSLTKVRGGLIHSRLTTVAAEKGESVGAKFSPMDV